MDHAKLKPKFCGSGLSPRFCRPSPSFLFCATCFSLETRSWVGTTCATKERASVWARAGGGGGAEALLLVYAVLATGRPCAHANVSSNVACEGARATTVPPHLDIEHIGRVFELLQQLVAILVIECSHLLNPLALAELRLLKDDSHAPAPFAAHIHQLHHLLVKVGNLDATKITIELQLWVDLNYELVSRRPVARPAAVVVECMVKNRHRLELATIGGHAAGQVTRLAIHERGPVHPAALHMQPRRLAWLC
eukprot:843081-Prymnesium_polylepis.2